MQNPLSACRMMRTRGQARRICATMRATSSTAPSLPATFARRCRASSKYRLQNTYSGR